MIESIIIGKTATEPKLDRSIG